MMREMLEAAARRQEKLNQIQALGGDREFAKELSRAGLPISRQIDNLSAGLPQDKP